MNVGLLQVEKDATKRLEGRKGDGLLKVKKTKQKKQSDKKQWMSNSRSVAHRKQLTSKIDKYL